MRRLKALILIGLLLVASTVGAAVFPTPCSATNPTNCSRGTWGDELRTFFAQTFDLLTGYMVSPLIDVRAYGVTLNGTTDDAAAFRLAVAAAVSTKGRIFVPGGNVLFNSEVVIPDYVDIECAGKRATIFRAGSNNVSIFHWTGSYGSLSRCGFNNALLKTGVSAIRLTPLDETQTITVVNQNDNVFFDLYISYFDEAFVLKAGPFVGGTASGCWYNKFIALDLASNLRGMWFKEGPNSGASGCNRNTVISTRIGTAPANTGVQIEGGTTTNEFDIDFEGIASGTAPNSTPTAIKYTNAVGATSGGLTQDNRWVANFEANTRDWDSPAGTEERLESTSPPTTIVGTPPSIQIDRITTRINSTLEIMTSGSATRRATVFSNSGGSSNFNGISISSNIKTDGTQGDVTLSSNMVDIGGIDNVTYPGTGGCTSIRQRPAGGAWSVPYKFCPAYIEGFEVSEPAAPGANGFRLFSKDNGAGKTQLCARFSTGAVQCFATEP